MDWKRLLRLEQNEVLGLDIGSSAVKMVKMRKSDGGFAVAAAGIVDIADEETEGDESRKEINTVRAIHKCLQSTGIQTQLAVCSVCGPEVAVRYFKFPSLPPEEIESAVLLEAEQVCPFNVDDGAVDYQLIAASAGMTGLAPARDPALREPEAGDNVSGVLVAATNKVMKKKRRLTENASLNCVLIDVDGLALLNCFSECEKLEAGRTITILNVGSSFTNLAIMGSNALPFVRDMAYAGDDIVKQIATESGVSVETVSKILSARGSPRQPSPSEGRGWQQAGASDKQEQPALEVGVATSTGTAMLEEGLKKASEKLITDVTDTLRYYMAQEKLAFVEKILVCGGFALVKGFVELLDDQLPAGAVLWNPFDKMRCSAGRSCEYILRKNGPALAVAAGLAMRQI